MLAALLLGIGALLDYGRKERRADERLANCSKNNCSMDSRPREL